MAFGMSPFPLQFGARGGGGASDPTAITPANADAFLASLGFAQAGTGATWGETGQASTPLYAVAAAKVPLGYDAEFEVFGPIVNPSGTNLALHGSDAANSAWSKSSTTAALSLGGLEHDADWRGTNRAVNGEFTTDAAGWTTNATATPVVTDGIVRITQTGAGSGLYQDFPFLAGEFVLITVRGRRSSGANPATGGFWVMKSAGFTGPQFIPFTTSYAEYTVILAGAGTAGRVYLTPQSDGAYVDVDYVRIEPVDAHTLLTSTGSNATCLQSITSASNPRVSKLWLARESGSGTISITQDGGSTWTNVTLTDDPQPFDIAAATFANPAVGARIATSGDRIKMYGAQHQVASRPLRPRIGPTVASTVTSGARTLIATLAESPGTVHLKMLVRTPKVDIAGITLFSVDNNAATNLIDLKADGSGGYVLRKVIASSETAFTAFAVATDTVVQIEVRISDSVFRYRIDGGSWVTGTAGIPGSLSRLRIGHDNANTGQIGQPVLAFEDLSTAAMLAGDRGWNKAALA